MAVKRMGIVKGDDDDFTYPPTLEGEIQRLKEEIGKLKQENEDLSYDGEHSLFWSLNKKQNEAARSLNSFVLDFAKEDKTFERYNLFLKGLEDSVKAVNLLRQDYLKIPEDKLQEAEKKGIPLIERRASSNRKK